MIPRALFTDTFKVKKTEQLITSGKITHIVNTVSSGNKGRFQSISGSRNRDFMGSIKQYSMVLYCDSNCGIEFGRIVENEVTCVQYDVVRVDNKQYYGDNHHMQVYLEERRTEIG